MRFPFQCKCGCSDFAINGESFRLVVAQFLWWRWIRKVRSGYIAVCTRHNCGLGWVVNLSGMREPAPNIVPPGARHQRPVREVEVPVDGDEREPRLPRDPLSDAVRRPVV
jgi:hypothetical protein